MNYNYIHNEKEKNCLANTTPHLRKQKIMYQKLPNATLLKSGHLSRQFRKIGIFTFHDACDFVWKLPYGRTSDKSNWLLVLSERTGTCSTKHALLKALANELSLNINLVLGIYPMKESNTPGVGTVVEKYGLEETEPLDISETKKKVEDHLNKLEFDKALNVIFAFVDHCNEYVQTKKPWETKDTKVLYQLSNAIKDIAILLSAFIPETSEKISEVFNFEINYKGLNDKLKISKIKKAEVMFKKIEND